MPKYRKIKYEERKESGYELTDWGNGWQEYRYNGKTHRKDGPAILHGDGNKYWYLKGDRLSKDWFLKHPDKIAKMRAWDLFEPEELVSLKLTGKP